MLSGVSDLPLRLEEKAAMFLRDANLAECDRIFCGALAELEHTPYHKVVALQFTNSPSLLAAHFDQCFSVETRGFMIRAAYTEMNGFDINPNRWYGNVFLYQSYGGHADYDWLAYPDAADFPDFTLTGMEPLQEVFAASVGFDRFGRPSSPWLSDARAICGLTVVTRFQQLIKRAAAIMASLHFPLLSTAHDYDFIAEVAPGRSLS